MSKFTMNFEEQSAKRPREVLDQENSMVKLVSDFKKIDEPTVKDLSRFLVGFLEASNNLNTRVCCLEDRVEKLEESTGLQSDRMNNIEDRLVSIESAQEELKKDLNAKFDALSLQIVQSTEESSKKISRNSSQIHYIQQTAMDKDIILKGFPTKPDHLAVVANFLDLFNVDPGMLRESYYVSYQRQQHERDGKTIEAKLLHFVVLAFKKKSTKIEIFQQKKVRGPLLLKELVTEIPEAQQRTIIQCTNKLSKFNLHANQVLYRAKSSSIVHEFKFHNQLYQYKVTENAEWIRVDTNEKVDYLEKQLPKTSSNKKKSSRSQ